MLNANVVMKRVGQTEKTNYLYSALLRLHPEALCTVVSVVECRQTFYMWEGDHIIITHIIVN